MLQGVVGEVIREHLLKRRRRKRRRRRKKEEEDRQQLEVVGELSNQDNSEILNGWLTESRSVVIIYKIIKNSLYNISHCTQT